jgi:hypothetical protein
MVEFLRDRLPERRARLLATAFCHRIKDLFVEPETLRAVEVIEGCADAGATTDDFQRAADAAVPNWDVFEFTTDYDDAQRAAVNAVVHAAGSHDPVYWACVSCVTAAGIRGTHSAVVPALAGLVRDVAGNPFRPVTLDPSWRTSTVVQLAEGIYADRAFDRLPILADALQDAGCENADILNHCRSAGPHVRGCWVVDLVLGKE